LLLYGAAASLNTENRGEGENLYYEKASGHEVDLLYLYRFISH